MTNEENRLAWLSCPAMPEELLAELGNMNEKETDDCFYRDLAFGTGGLRGVLGAGTNRMNVFTVLKATRGLGQYLKAVSSRPSCAVSYDSRIHSRDFAELTAAALAEMGIQVWLYSSLSPTPMLSYAVRHHHASAGVMVTASHNPAKYNGYKVYGADGCQITLDAAKAILSSIEAQPDLADSLPDFRTYLSEGMIQYIPDETVEAYYRDIMKLRVHPAGCPLHLVYSPLNGTGNLPVREMMRRLGYVKVDVVPEQELPDGHFPTCPYPNPEIREAMALAIEKTVAVEADLCFATDPDCDRMGAGIRVGKEVVLISGNDMGILMLDYLLRNKAAGKAPFVVVKTIVTTEMAAALCEKAGAELRNVLTGFKFIGEQIGFLEKQHEEDRFLFGFEESYGYLSGTDVRDKDAVNAALLLCEMASSLKAEGKTLLDRLEELRQEFGCYAQRLLTFEYDGEDGSQKMQAIMESLRTPGDLSACPLPGVASRTDYAQGIGLLPPADVLEFRMQNGAKLVIRPSGTEPKIKVYLFANAQALPEAESVLGEMETAVGALLMKS
ncbi:MAG: phospho-sugar mutase [Clostridia bacterium]|nr:phospho-sugar mutase [Clostridia bacterium]